LIPESCSVKSSASSHQEIIMHGRGTAIMKILHGALGLTFLVIASGICKGQVKHDTGTVPPSQVETKPSNCEFNISVLTGAHRVAGEDGLVIMIARLGKGEVSRDLGRRRLHNARTFLTEFGNRHPQMIVTAEGDRVDGYGRVELYASGKLFHVLLMSPNADLPVGACSFEGDDPCASERERKLYPCLDRRKRRSAKKQ
jgi:hypothetical protein